MKVALLADYPLEWRDVDIFFDSEEFLRGLYEERYDAGVVYFDFYAEMKEVRDFYQGALLFIDRRFDPLHLKRALEIGDYYFLADEYDRIVAQLEYLRKKLYGERVLKAGELYFDRISGRCFKGQKEFHLTPAERAILQLLACNRPVSFDEIFERGEISNKESLKVVVARLRKLGFAIESLKNYGYQLQKRRKR